MRCKLSSLGVQVSGMTRQMDQRATRPRIQTQNFTPKYQLCDTPRASDEIHSMASAMGTLTAHMVRLALLRPILLGLVATDERRGESDDYGEL